MSTLPLTVSTGWQGPSAATTRALTLARRLGRTLVLAPHPDDETIGCGGLLALLAQAGVAVRVVLVSDGAASHPNSVSHPPPLLRALRQKEMHAALRELGLGAPQLSVLGLPDGAVPLHHETGFDASFRRLAGITLAFSPSCVLLPWRDDAHRDHRATQALGAAVCRQVAPHARQLEYPVWPPPGAHGVAAERAAAPWAWQINITPVLTRKRSALAQHRSQRGQVVQDDPAGFVLPPALAEACLQPVETYYCFPSPENARPTGHWGPQHGAVQAALQTP